METIMLKLTRENTEKLIDIALAVEDVEENRFSEIILDQYSADGRQRFIISVETKDIIRMKEKWRSNGRGNKHAHGAD